MPTKKKYIETEQRILNLFPMGGTFSWENTTWTVLISGKPVAQHGGGEGKTDIYIRATNVAGEIKEFKISLKMLSADFVENKISSSRMEQIAGPDWLRRYKPALEKLIIEVDSIKNPVVPSRITIGYRMDVFSTNKRRMLSNLPLTEREKYEAYAGANLSEPKLHSKVVGKIIDHSGAASHLLYDTPSLTSPESVLDSLLPIEQFVQSDECQLYVGVGAVNYRKGGKFERSRPLALRYEYFLDSSGKICHTLTCQNALTMKSNEAVGLIPPEILGRYQ